jgi:hypothetical protein
MVDMGDDTEISDVLHKHSWRKSSKKYRIIRSYFGVTEGISCSQEGAICRSQSAYSQAFQSQVSSEFKVNPQQRPKIRFPESIIALTLRSQIPQK